MTVVGHTLDSGREFPSPEELVEEIVAEDGTTVVKQTTLLKVNRTSDLVPSFIVQDDSAGPYRLLEFFDWDEAQKKGLISYDVRQKLEATCICLARFDDSTPSYVPRVVAVNSIIAPLPPGVTVAGNEAEARAYSLLASWYRQQGPAPDHPVLLRTFLIPSNALKRTWPRPGMPTDLSRQLRRHPMSKSVWVTEISDAKTYCDEKRITGQVIHDSTGDLLALTRISNLIQTSRPSGGLERLYS